MFELVDVKFKDILHIPALTIEDRKVTTLVGPSGSGKTTLLRLLNKMISPTAGNILFHGENLSDLVSVAHRRNVLMLSQTPTLFAGTISENLTAGIRFQNRPVPSDEVMERMLEQVQLDKALRNGTEMLSGGEKQRLALGRIMLMDPEVFLLDEPSSALDDLTEEQIIEMLMAHVRTQCKTMVLVTHSNVIAEKYSDRIIEITAGTHRQRR